MNQKIDQFLQNPIVVILGLLGGLCSIIGIPLTLYLSDNEPVLTYYYSNDTRAQISLKYNSSGLHIFHDSHPGEIKEDVSLIQLCVWNAGRKPIEAKDIRAPLTIYTSDSAEILEARVIKSTNSNTNIKLNDSLKSKGKIGISLDILEKNDGVVIQFLYIGGDKTDFTLKGKVVGQRKIKSSYNILPGYHFADILFALFGICFLSSLFILLILAIVKIAFKQLKANKTYGLVMKVFNRIAFYSMGILLIVLFYGIGSIMLHKAGLISTPFSYTEMNKVINIGHFKK